MTFDANGGNGGISVSMAFGAPLSAPVVTRTGYTFAGWSPSVPISVPVGGGKYTAQWTVNSYKITFDANGGTGGTSGALLFGTSLTAPAVIRTGYTLTGWSPELPASVPAADITYTAQWSQNHYTITFDAGGGSGGTIDSYVYGEPISAPNVAKTGYTFTGWLPSVPATAPAENTVYTAQWSVNSYLLTFNANGGKGGTSASVAYGTVINAPTVTKTGYTFTGWNLAVPATMPAGSLTFNATWTPNLHDAVFIVDGNEYSRAHTAFAASIQLPPNPVKEGSIFLGWDPSIPTSMPDQDVSFTAQWYNIGFTVSFNLNGGAGTVPANQIVSAQSYAALPAQGDITRSGYIFLGWSNLPNAAAPVSNFLVNDNVILYAVWGTSQISLSIRSGSTTIIESGTNLIYGIRAGITREEFENSFVAVAGNGSLVYTPASGNFGTGTKVQLVDNSSGSVLQTYVIVIFGDVNGDGNINNIDAGLLINVENYVTSWDQTADKAYIIAGDLNNDGNITGVDAGIVMDVENYVRSINQVTGLTV